MNAGLRLSEITNLKWENINLIIGRIKVVNGKGAKDRFLWINEKTLELLRHCKERQIEEIGRCDYIFTTLKGSPVLNRYIQDMINRYSKKAGIDKNISPHTLRHTFATDLYRETKNIRIVQKALGHSDLSTTMVYTHIVDDEMEEALKSFREE